MSNDQNDQLKLTAREAGIVQLTAGCLIDERFLIESCLGKGGMGTVYKARHRQLEKTVALKMLNQNLFEDSDALQRFQRETMAVSSLHHPNIVEVYGSGLFNDRPYMVLEYLDGTSLASLLEQLPGHRLPVEKATPIFLQICDGLAHAHGKGIIHRDIKPSNVMLSGPDNHVHLVDFGLAKMLPDSGKDLQKITQTGEILGSAAYMSPEQCLGLPLDERSDIYSLGCLMYEAITGDAPFAATTAYATIAQHVSKDPEVGELLRSPIGNVILSTLEKDRARRPQSAAELKQALLHPKTVKAGKSSRRARAIRMSVLSPWWAALFCVCLTALLAAAVWLTRTPPTHEELLAAASDQMKIADDMLAEIIEQSERELAKKPSEEKAGFDEAIKDYRRALKTAIDSRDQAAIAYARAKLAFALARASQDDEAILLSLQVLNSGNDVGSTSRQHLLALEAIGNAYLNKGEYHGAIAYWKEYEGICPTANKTWALVHLGEAYLGDGQTRQARETFNAAIKEADYVRHGFSRLTSVQLNIGALTRARLGLARTDLAESHGNRNSPEYKRAIVVLKELKDAKSADESAVNLSKTRAITLLESLHEQ